MRSPDQIGISWEENQLLMQQLREKAALEYRRQHNIFEEGDWVIIPSRGNGIFQVSRLLCRSDVQEIIHATDAEIEAGKRLEVNDGST